MLRLATALSCANVGLWLATVLYLVYGRGPAAPPDAPPAPTASHGVASADASAGISPEQQSALHGILDRLPEVETDFEQLLADSEQLAAQITSSREQLTRVQLLLSYLEEFTLVRVRNDTGTDLSDVTVHFPGESMNYGDVPSGQLSKYRPVVVAHSMARVTAKSRTLESLEASLFCDVGETHIGRGRFVGVLRLSEGKLSFDIRREDP